MTCRSPFARRRQGSGSGRILSIQRLRRWASSARPRSPMASILKKRENDSALVGLEIEAGSIGAAEVHTQRLGATRRQRRRSPLPPEAFHDGEVDRPGGGRRRRCARCSTRTSSAKRVRLGIANQRVVVRTLRLPAIEDPTELDSAVRFSAQEQIAMPLEQAVIDHRVVGGVPRGRGRAAADRRDRRRRPPRHDRRLAEAAARRRPRTGRGRPLGLRR